MAAMEPKDIIQKELDSLMPKGLSDQEQAVWKMLFNALRENDLAKEKPSGGGVVALHATVEAVLGEDCGQKTFTVTDDNKIIIVTCTNPKIDIQGLVDAKKSLFSPWIPHVSSYESHPDSENSLVAYKIKFTK